jgi:hypothetical protein
VVKRFDEALAEIRLAEQLDPLSPAIGNDLGASLVFAADTMKRSPNSSARLFETRISP